MADAPRIRFVEVLTTGSAVANYLGVADVTARHLLSAISILREETTLEDLGRPLSPMLRRGQPGSDPGVREFAQRWFARLGGDAHAELADDLLTEMLVELQALAANSADGRERRA